MVVLEAASLADMQALRSMAWLRFLEQALAVFGKN
jgi:hypothetical protein